MRPFRSTSAAAAGARPRSAAPSLALASAALACCAWPPTAAVASEVAAATSGASEVGAATRVATPSTRRWDDEIEVRGRRFREQSPSRFAHSLREVDGTKITVTKRTSVQLYADQPVAADGSLRAQLNRLPGVLLAEQQSPTQANLNYRGIGNPQESEYLLVMRDGLPIMSDWIGFPTLYTLPAPQTIQSVQLIRGGNGLLYGPEPGGVLNFTSRPAALDTPLALRTEHVGGANGLYSGYAELSGTSEPFDYLVDAGVRRGDGQRGGGDYDVRHGDVRLGWHVAPDHVVRFDFVGYRADTGDAGRITRYADWVADDRYAPTPSNRIWMDRYTGTLSYRGKLAERWLLDAKLWHGRQDLGKRSQNAPPTTAVIDREQFTFTGLDVRARYTWGRGNAATFGAVAYESDAPWHQYTVPGLDARRHDTSGTPRLAQERTSRYAAAFAETVLRFPAFHLVPSVRIDREELSVRQSVGPNARLNGLPLDYTRTVPLFGLGIGNDFGAGNETYLSVSQGYRPLRFLDVASPFGATTDPARNFPDPAKSLSIEAGVHGWSVPGLYYDVGVFQVNFRDRIETRALSATDSINVNTGDTRHRGLEFEAHYDLLARRARAAQFEVFANASLLDAEFTASLVPNQVGRRPAYAPHYVARYGFAYREPGHWLVSLTGISVGEQYWQDSNQPGAGASPIPAQIPAVTVLDAAAEYTVLPHVTLTGGVGNLTDRVYYSRVFGNGLEPALRRTWYAGVRLTM